VVDARPFRPPAGWFVAADLFLARSHSIIPPPLFWGGGPVESVPELGTSLSPQGTFGYRFERGNALLASYRYLSGSGQNDPPSTAVVHGDAGFNSHWVDLDYRGCLHGPWLWMTFQWQTGVRIAAVSYDNRSNWQDRLTVHDEINFFGAGPHFGIDLNWYLGPTGLGVFGRLDGGLVFGHGTQHTTDHFRPSANYFIVGANGPTDVIVSDSSQSTLGTGFVECGLSFSPSTRRWLRFEGGCREFLFAAGNRLVSNFGPFLRCEVGF
jgi:hypothetical protein